MRDGAGENARGTLRADARNHVGHVSRRAEVAPRARCFVRCLLVPVAPDARGDCEGADSVIRSQLCTHVAAATSLPNDDASAALGALFSAIADALARDETVTLARFGKFTTRRRAARKGRNPQTGDVVASRCRPSAPDRPFATR